MTDLPPGDPLGGVDVDGMRRGEPAAWPRWRAQYLDADEVVSAWRAVLPRPGRTLNVYVHFPYCQSNCRFCMYWSRATHEPRRLDDFTDYLVALLARFGGGHFATHAYVGGGTPSYLDSANLRRLLAAFGRTFQVRDSFTMEANPLSLDEDKLEVMVRHGVNRLSLGVQSFDPSLLKRIGRLNGPPERTARLVARARDLGMEVNIDILIGLPGQEPILADEARAAMRLGVETVTAYRYMPTPKLPEHGAVRFDLLRAMWREIVRTGYVPAVPRDVSRYGARLWQPGHALRLLLRALSRGHREYGCFSRPEAHLLGLGPGAWSHLHGYAWYREVTALRALEAGPVYCGTRLTLQEERNTILRRQLHAGRAVSLAALDPAVAARALERGWLKRRARWVWMKSDEVLDELMPAAATHTLGEPPLPVERLLRFDAPSLYPAEP